MTNSRAENLEVSPLDELSMKLDQCMESYTFHTIKGWTWEENKKWNDEIDEALLLAEKLGYSLEEPPAARNVKGDE